MKTLARGIWSGILATSPMTLAMFRLYRDMPIKDQAPMPPAILTDELLGRLGLGTGGTPEQRSSTSLFSHFGYGASAGLLFSYLASKTKSSPIPTGILFGLGVWAVSYAGLIPAFGLRPSAQNMSRNRNILEILAHVVWGASLGFADHELKHRGNAMLDGSRGRLAA